MKAFVKSTYFINVFLVFFMSTGCTTYRDLVTVTPRNDVPEGSTAIIVSAKIDEVKKMFIDNGVMLRTLEGGIETESVQLDEGTRAMFKAHDFDESVRITAFWGITQKAKRDIQLSLGDQAADQFDVNAWEQVIYKRNALRPKKVFDFGLNMVTRSGIPYTIK